MGFDIRLVIGLMFVLVGSLLAGYGWLGDQSIYARSLGINVNLWWGLVILLMGIVLLWLARRAATRLAL